MQNNKRIGWVDLARGAAVLSIIFSHSGYLPFSAYLSPVMHTFMIPVFLFTGGYFFHPGSDYLSFTQKKIKKLLIPYLIFFL
ncbi:MAG: acyltransferase family protein, partial [Patescibacteria group bacterium]